MQRYLQHVHQSRIRLEKCVEKLSAHDTRVYARGTVLPDCSLEELCKNPPVNEHKLIPFFRGSLGFLKPGVSAMLLDASLRKSVSYSIRHLHDSLEGGGLHGRSDDFVKWLASGPDIGHAQVLALFLFHVQYPGTRPDCLGSGKEGWETRVALVGNEIASTMDEARIPGWQAKMMFNSAEQFAVSITWPMLLNSARLAVRKDIVKETEDFMFKPTSLRVVDGEGNLDVLRPDSGDSRPLIEGFKVKAVKQDPKWARRRDCQAYRFCIEIEMDMMEQMLSALENQEPRMS